MATKTVFLDKDENEMECFINKDERVYIGVGKSGEDNIYSGYITLDKNDVQELIKILTELESQMR
jgi:hypothetical protein